ncbi:(2Fe-2S)-binding protein [Trinickia dinghuensis]|uniref:(2Fe-2S)-binding protein n=1 Tax=Trinickia dinghuensis TaxID=2291023 RepID=A0A3D8JT91_9BURK|nr:(2Fe-2S)-binding protein [Trinickia dinghuensis]RDU96349.1 (2Fe-2S)-binding protein [Trinickia dinghuensis]
MAYETADRAAVPVVVTIDGVPLEVPEYTTAVAAVFRRYGVRGTRVSVGGQPRAALCAMGVCQECRMTIDGRAHVLACQTICRDGMTIRTEGAPS